MYLAGSPVGTRRMARSRCYLEAHPTEVGKGNDSTTHVPLLPPHPTPTQGLYTVGSRISATFNYYTALHCTALYNTILYYTILYYTAASCVGISTTYVGIKLNMYVREAVTDATVSNVTVLFWLLTFSTASDYHIRVAQHLAVGGEGWGGVGRVTIANKLLQGRGGSGITTARQYHPSPLPPPTFPMTLALTIIITTRYELQSYKLTPASFMRIVLLSTHSIGVPAFIIDHCD